MNETTSAPPSRPAGHRRRHTRPAVIWWDRIASVTIRVGGGCVIVAVLGILIYLVSVVVPLFEGADLERQASYGIRGLDGNALLFARVDEYRLLGVAATRDGVFAAFDARTGAVLGRRGMFPAARTMTAHSAPGPAGDFAAGFDDGSIVIARLSFPSRPVAAGAAGPPAAGDSGALGALAGGEAEALRFVEARVDLEAPIEAEVPGPVHLMDLRPGDPRTVLAVMQDDGALTVHEIVRRRNLMTGRTTRNLASRRFVLTGPSPGDLPSFLLITPVGDQALIAWEDGRVERVQLDDGGRTVQRLDVTSADVALRGFSFLPGERSIIATGSDGSVRAWFLVPTQGDGAAGQALVPAHDLASHADSVSIMAPSLRHRSFLTCGEDGSIHLHHLTSEKLLASTSVSPARPLRSCQIAPRGDGIFAIDDAGNGTLWSLDVPHPETSLSSIFGKVWYEGYPAPSWTWQSSSGTDDFEPKLSLVPLIFGTLKATLYSMLFAVPHALPPAIYTSEFLERKWRAPIKSTIEMMASLPSVILGFLAALVLAPLVEGSVIAIITAFLLAPAAALAAGFAWQALPRHLAGPLARRWQFPAIFACVLAAILAAPWFARLAERALFAGDFRAWLSGRGDGTAGTACLAWPVCAIVMVLLRRRSRAGGVGRPRTPGPARRAAGEAALWGGTVVAAWFLAWGAVSLGFDPRGTIVDTYVQRNALIVGFAMGFAVIPIIYTIAEDALSAVPASLRSASLGCGATRWQTATRVVLPVAASGIYSALMVGLGRAVGETMIVLMAAGNTPLMDVNVFNGLRALSANIAVELPEAVKDGTLYRMLFLSALLLFILTFIVNTVAEMVRLRVRRRTFQL